MVQLAAPLAPVTVVQLWAAPPEPRVKVTVRPETSVPEVGWLVVSTPDNVAELPLVTEVMPVYVKVVGACVSVNVVEELLDVSCGMDVLSPPKEAVSE